VSAAPATILEGRTIGARYRKRRIRGRRVSHQRHAANIGQIVSG